MSTDWPCTPPWGWWISTRAFGSAVRMPGAPAASSTAAADAAWPTQVVATGGCRNVIVSGMANRPIMSPPGRVDVEVDRLLGVLGLEEQQLGHDQVGDLVVDRRAQEDDPLAEQPRVDVVGTLAAGRGLDDGGDEHGFLLVAHPSDAQLLGCASL